MAETPRPDPEPAQEPEQETFPRSESAEVELVADPEYHGQLPGALVALLALLQPVLGALPAAAKEVLEQYANHRGFRARWATVWNIVLNSVLYVGAAGWMAARWEGKVGATAWWIGGVALALGEAIVRLWPVARPGFPPRLRYRGSFYGWALGTVLWPFIDTILRPLALKHAWDVSPKKPVPEGIVRVAGELEKRRRYGMVHQIRRTPLGYRITQEFPRQTPPAVLDQDPELPRELPHYAYTVRAEPGRGVVIFAWLDDPRFQAVAGRDADFPSSFETVFPLPDVGSIARTHYDAERRVLTVEVARQQPQVA